MTVSGAGQPENQAWGWTESGPLEGFRGQAHFSPRPLLRFPVSGESHWLRARHPLVTLIDSCVRISGQRRGAGPQRLIEKLSPNAKGIDTRRQELCQSHPWRMGIGCPVSMRRSW